MHFFSSRRIKDAEARSALSVAEGAPWVQVPGVTLEVRRGATPDRHRNRPIGVQPRTSPGIHNRSFCYLGKR